MIVNIDYGDYLHDCDDGFNNYHKYCHNLDNGNDWLTMMTVSKMINVNDFCLGVFPPVVHLLFDGKYNSVLDILSHLLFRPPATSRACLKYRRKTLGQILDIFTCSPWLVRKLVQLCEVLGVARSGSEPRCSPSELYLTMMVVYTCPPSHG